MQRQLDEHRNNLVEGDNQRADAPGSRRAPDGAAGSPRPEAAARRPQSIPYAVQSRRAESADSLDYFPTPPWATRALCEWLFERGYAHREHDVLEPACGTGDMSRPLGEYFGRVHASDVHDYGIGAEVADFLAPSGRRAAWIITNPPFKRGEAFVHTALERADCGVAIIARLPFLESAGRYDRLYKSNPPTEVLQFVERVPMLSGRLNKRASSATAYAWFLWREDGDGPTRVHWIPRCRKRLERDSDYADRVA